MQYAIEKARATYMAGEEMGGQGATEYAILIGFIVIIAATSVLAFSNQLAAMWDKANEWMKTIASWNHTVTTSPGDASTGTITNP